MKKLLLLWGLLMVSNLALADLDKATKAQNQGDIAGAIKEWKATVAKGKDYEIVIAATNLGILYYDGKDVPIDYVESAKWLEKAATPIGSEKGDPEAGFILGQMYYNGQGVIRDLKQARYYWTLSGKQGYVASIRAMQEVFNEKVFP